MDTRFNASTLQRFNASTLLRFNASTLLQCNPCNFFNPFSLRLKEAAPDIAELCAATQQHRLIELASQNLEDL